MASAVIGNGQAIAGYIAGAGDRALPAEVADMARLCLADWLGVAVGAREEPAGRIVRDIAAGWRSSGRASVLFGGTAAAPFAALANGTLAHCLDFDDTYVKAVTHISARRSGPRPSPSARRSAPTREICWRRSSPGSRPRAGSAAGSARR
jgi:hypothetical protein